MNIPPMLHMLQQTGDIMWQKQSKAEDMESPKKVVVPPNHAKLDRFSLEIGDLGIPHFNPDFARIPLRLLLALATITSTALRKAGLLV